MLANENILIGPVAYHLQSGLKKLSKDDTKREA